MAQDAAIRVSGLHKSYGEHEAVRGIDFEVGKGEVFGFLGPNGAGKTTTVEILEGYRERTAGEVSVLGHRSDPRHPRSGGDPDRPGPPGMRARPAAHGHRDDASVLASFFPNPARSRRMRPSSLRRSGRQSGTRGSARYPAGSADGCDVGVGIVGNPELLFLDEPTTGFDPTARRDAWNMIQGLRDLGTTIVLTTHYMEEAAAPRR